jgi:hypothetical protein
MGIESIKSHLAEYKNKVLNVSANGTWKKNNKQYAHILPEILQEKNILNSDYHKMIIDEIVNTNVKLHSDFHHLNSSQALCFNLFYPLFLENLFFVLFNNQNEIVENYEFEHIEDKHEKTNFDLFVKTNRLRYYFEIKYTENEFGKAKSNVGHILKYNEVYKDKIKIFKDVSMEMFFSHYQIFRNLIYNNGRNIFVFPSNRCDLKNAIVEVIKNHCTEEQRKHIVILSIEEIIKIILDKESGNRKIVNHYKLFEEKYFGMK